MSDNLGFADTPIVDECKITSKLATERKTISEVNVSGFAHYDQEVAFFSQVSALLRPQHHVLDFGAGRGEWFYDDAVTYRRNIQNFRGRCAHVAGCDIDPTVMENPTLDRAVTFQPGERLPFDDDSFDLIVSRYVFEHIVDPQWASSELMRVLKPGGWLCAVTPNKYGYVAIASRLVPNRLHAAFLRAIQPHRKELDVFPTVYKLNTPRSIRKYFGVGGEVRFYRDSAVPSYHFGSPFMLRFLRLVHALLPPPLGTGFFIFVRKLSPRDE